MSRINSTEKDKMLVLTEPRSIEVLNNLSNDFANNIMSYTDPSST